MKNPTIDANRDRLSPATASQGAETPHSGYSYGLKPLPHHSRDASSQEGSRITQGWLEATAKAPDILIELQDPDALLCLRPPPAIKITHGPFPGGLLHPPYQL